MTQAPTFDAKDALEALSEDRLETQYGDFKPALTKAQALTEANRCLYCHDAPCIKSCPTSIDIPEFIRRIATDNVLGSAKTILESNILGLSCARVCPTEVLCESTCVYNELHSPPIKIGKLQRYATEHAYAKNARFFERGEETGKHVALIGAGPASLACAHELSRLGHSCTIFEGRSTPGGLNSTGIAPYKLKVEDSLLELDYVLQIGGIELKTNTLVGRDVSMDTLLNDFDAVFVGVGLGPDGWLDAPGQDLPGVEGAVAFIERLKLDPSFSVESVQNVAVIGGGNTALDAVRETLGLGFKSVSMVYRRGEASMSGYRHEWDAARTEGAQGVFFAQPVEFVAGDDGNVRAVRCARTQSGTPDPETGYAPLVVTPDTFEVQADLILLAVGQHKLTALLDTIPGLELNRGRVIVNAQQQTGNPKVFAGGDCANGGKEVVNAADEGKRAAQAIDAMLQPN